MKNIKQSNTRAHGFTIVELLVVIVVIGILAAITIVSYSGVTNKAYKATAQTAADTVSAKASAYAAEDSNNYYPKLLTSLTTASSTTSYFLPAAVVTLDPNGITAAPLTTAANTVSIQVCGAGDTTTAPTDLTTMTKPIGMKVQYWNFSDGSASTWETLGNMSGTISIGGSTYNTSCVYLTS